ncbi:MAG: DedA family protein [Actinomycetota bacterium]|nr:DedA family protein [Actinomycetota bacterium]
MSTAATAANVLAVGSAGLLHHLLVLRGFPAYAIVGALVFAEAAIFVGFVLPGETAVILGGVLANQHAASLTGMATVVVLAAVLGDSTGYEVGRRYGARLVRLPLIRSRKRSIDRAERFLREKGGRAVFLGRFTAFLRAVTPALAGLSRLPYRRFLPFNAAGALVWGVGFTLVGYLAGAGYAKVEKVAGRASLGVFGLLVVGFVLVRVRSARRERARG